MLSTIMEEEEVEGGLEIDQSTLDLLNSYTPHRTPHHTIIDPYTLTPPASRQPTTTTVAPRAGATGTKKPTLANHPRGPPAAAAKPAAKPTTRPPMVKSTKPPTWPCFELPGEAVSRRLREERQARRRREEEAAEERRRSGARPVRPSTRPRWRV